MFVLFQVLFELLKYSMTVFFWSAFFLLLCLNICCAIVSLLFSLTLNRAFRFSNLWHDSNSLLSLCLLHTLGADIKLEPLFLYFLLKLFYLLFQWFFLTLVGGWSWSWWVFSSVILCLKLWIALLWFVCLFACVLHFLFFLFKLVLLYYVLKRQE